MSVVTVDCDRAVSNAAAASLVAAWQRAGAGSVETYEFPPELRIPTT
jgi:hypothetical protein